MGCHPVPLQASPEFDSVNLGWRAKSYVNITREPLPFQITGPLGTVDQDKKAKLILRPGHAVVATMVDVSGTGKQHFARSFTSTKHGTRGVVCCGCTHYEPMKTPASSQESTSRTRANRARTRLQQSRDLDEAYKALPDEAFAPLKQLLAISPAEEESALLMKPAKRRWEQQK